MRTTNDRRRATRGFTLVESLIAVTLLAVLFLAVAQTSSRASSAFDEGSAEHALSTGTHRCLERIARAVEYSGASILTWGTVPTNLGDDNVTFQTPVDFAGGAVTWTVVQIFAELEPGELDDGKDNDGDELVDELRVVQVDAGGTRVLANGVAKLFQGELPNNLDDNENGLIDEAGLSFSSVENVLTLRLTCQRRDDGGRLLTKTAETAVRPRN